MPRMPPECPQAGLTVARHLQRCYGRRDSTDSARKKTARNARIGLLGSTPVWMPPLTWSEEGLALLRCLDRRVGGAPQ